MQHSMHTHMHAMEHTLEWHFCNTENMEKS